MDTNDLKKKNNERLLSWILTAVGIGLVVVGALGYILQNGGETAPPSSSVATSPKNTPLPVNPKSPILLITVDSLDGNLLNEARKNPTLAPNFLRLVNGSTYFSKAYAASSSPIAGVTSIVTGVLPSTHQYYWLPWFHMRGKTVAPPVSAERLAPGIVHVGVALPHFEKTAWLTDWWIWKNPSLRTDWRSVGAASFRSGSTDKLSAITESAVQDFVARFKQATAPRAFYWFHFDGLRAPYEVSPSKLGGFPKGLAAPTPAQLSSLNFMRSVKDPQLNKNLYLAAVRTWDDNLGKLIDGVKSASGFDSATILLSGARGVAWPGGTEFNALHTPLLLKEAGQKSGAVYDKPVSTASAAATIRALAGFPDFSQFRAPPLLIPLRGTRTASPSFAVAENPRADSRAVFSISENAAIRCTDKLSNPKATWEMGCVLYDLKADPSGHKSIMWGSMNDAQRRLVNKLQAGLRPYVLGKDPYALAKAAR